MTTRREFLKQTTILTAGALFTPPDFKMNFLSKPKVAILGAGLAGLSAGKMLSENGYDVTILEARNRVGGRVHSFSMDPDITIELGAEWIGKSHPRILSLCKELNLELINNEFDDRLIYDNKFYKPEEWDYSPEWKQKFEKILKDYETLTQSDKIKLDNMDWWRFLMNNDIPHRDLELREYSDSTDFGESIRFVSAYGALAEYAESDVNNEMDLKVKGGNSRLTEALAEKIGLKNIKLNHKADSVIYDSNIKIKCSNGETLDCDKLICTIPTYSVSKINWSPSLPENKINAINALQYSRISKSATLFKEKFWKDESFSILTDTFSHYFYHASKNQNSKKGVLISYSVGDKADLMSGSSQIDREGLVVESLRPAFGDIRDMVEKNVNYYWGNDEYSKGAYALYGKGQWFTIMPVLREKMNNNIYFAGEHIADWQGFMEGAIESGEDAAKEIMG